MTNVEVHFLKFSENKAWYFMCIFCQQTTHMIYQAAFGQKMESRRVNLLLWCTFPEQRYTR